MKHSSKIFSLQVTRLCDLSSEGNTVTSVAWSERGNQVAVGTQKGHISVWDVTVNKEVSAILSTYVRNNKSVNALFARDTFHKRLITFSKCNI